MASPLSHEAPSQTLRDEGQALAVFRSILKPPASVSVANSLPSSTLQSPTVVDLFIEPAAGIASTTALPKWPPNGFQAILIPNSPLSDPEYYSPSSGPTFSSAGTVCGGADVDSPPLTGSWSPSAFGGEGGFRCPELECTASPFETQQLLNSHANIHASLRPHFCPVAGCPRGPGGKGFKREDELIRHGLIHESPGYTCPFCPSQTRRYPRPDNLQRHVRVHHMDKDQNDLLLRQVLAERPAGPKRVRRRMMISGAELAISTDIPRLKNYWKTLHCDSVPTKLGNSQSSTDSKVTNPPSAIEVSQNEESSDGGAGISSSCRENDFNDKPMSPDHLRNGIIATYIQADERLASGEGPVAVNTAYDSDGSDSDISDSGYLQTQLYSCEARDQLSILHLDCHDYVSWNPLGPIAYGLMYADQLVSSELFSSANPSGYISTMDGQISKKTCRSATDCDSKILHKTDHIQECGEASVLELESVPKTPAISKGSARPTAVEHVSSENLTFQRGCAVLSEQGSLDSHNLTHSTEFLFCRPSCLSTSAEESRSSTAGVSRKAAERGPGCTLCGRSSQRIQTGQQSARKEDLIALRGAVEGDQCRQLESSSDLSPYSGKPVTNIQSSVQSQSDLRIPQSPAESVRQTQSVLKAVRLGKSALVDEIEVRSSDDRVQSLSPRRSASIHLPYSEPSPNSLSTSSISRTKRSWSFRYGLWSRPQPNFRNIASPPEYEGTSFASRTQCDSRSVNLLSDGERSFMASPESDELMEDWETNLDPVVRLLRSELIAGLIESHMHAEIQEEVTHNSDINSTLGRDDDESSCNDAAVEVGKKDRGSGSGSSSSSAASDCVQSNVSTRNELASSTTSTGKHSRPQDNLSAEFEEDPGGPTRKKRRVTTTSISSDGRLLACPYCKNDPTRYSDRNLTEKNYRGCSSIYLSTISRLKQHLYRVHKRPDHYCLSCFRIFTSQSSLSAHNRARPSCELHPPLFEEKMTPEQVTSIKRRTVGKSLSDAWFGIFMVLFPDSSLPESPFVDSVSSKAIQNFADHFYRQARARLASLIQTQLEGRMLLESDQQRILNTALEESIAQLVRRTSPQAEDGIGQESPEAPISAFQDNPCEDARSHGLRQAKGSLPQSSLVADSSERNDPDVGQVFGESWCPDLQLPPGIATFDEPVVDWSVPEFETYAHSKNEDAQCLVQVTRDEKGRTSRHSTPQLTQSSPGIINTDDWGAVNSSAPVLETFEWYLAALEHEHDPKTMPHQCEETPKGLDRSSG